MMTRGNWSASIGAGTMALLFVSGCTATGSSYADLQAEAGSKDALPEDLVNTEFSEEFDLDTMRSVGSHEGAELWLTEGSGRDEVCLVAYIDGGGYSACSAAGSLVEMGTQELDFLVAPDSAGTPEGTEAISSNVYAYTG